MLIYQLLSVFDQLRAAPGEGCRGDPLPSGLLHVRAPFSARDILQQSHSTGQCDAREFVAVCLPFPSSFHHPLS